MRYMPVVLLALAVGPLAAQQGVPAATAAPSAAAVSRAAELITADVVKQHVEALAADSMRERGTPSRGLDRAAQYVLGEFSKLGVGASLQQYPIPGSRRMNPAVSRLLFVTQPRRSGKPLLGERGRDMTKSVAVTFAGAARPGVSAMPEGGADWQLGWLLGGAQSKPTPMVIVSGRHTAESLARDDMRRSVTLYVPPAGIDSASERRVIEQLRQSSSVVVLSADDDATFARRRRETSPQPPAVIEGYVAAAMGVNRWVVYVRADAIEHFLRMAGVDLARARADTAPTVRQVPELTTMLEVQADGAEGNGPNGANVVGMIPGTDPQLANECVVFSAHLDNGRDGKDDNATGIAGLIALAKAFSRPEARPRRSLIFLATSGAADGSPGLGANFFAQSPTAGPPMLNITLDDIGAGARDSVVIDGLEDADFVTRPDWVVAQHPELGLGVADGGTISDPAREHFAFVRRAVATLSFHGEARDSGPNAAASAARDAGKAAQVARLAYYVGQELANAQRRPKWNSMGRRYRLMALEQ